MQRSSAILVSVALLTSLALAVPLGVQARHGPDECDTDDGYQNGGTDGETLLPEPYVELEDLPDLAVYADTQEATLEVWLEYNDGRGLQRTERTCEGCIHEDRDRVLFDSDRNTNLDAENGGLLGSVYAHTTEEGETQLWLETNRVPGLQLEDRLCQEECDLPSDTLLFPEPEVLPNIDRLRGFCPAEA